MSDGGDNDRIRVPRTDGSVATLAGGTAGFQDGQGAAARLGTPSGLGLDATTARCRPWRAARSRATPTAPAPKRQFLPLV